jgi:4-diphosphocytidyl-2-C-methyl-D-erythritol kinase
MIAFPRSKINLGLSIVSKRPDGFHNLETVFYPLPKRDVLEIIPARTTCLFSSGLPIPGDSGQNLILKAFYLLQKIFPQILPLEVLLYKAIPIGSGMGGGSSDAAEMLRMLSGFFSLPISADGLTKHALALGSDCPFFLQESACLASGRGEILEPISLDLTGYSLLLVHPAIKIDTAWAFSKINPVRSANNLKEIINRPVDTWPGILRNDFEGPVFGELPFLKTIKEQLYSSGALYASMTGSGSTIFGIFPKGNLPDFVIDGTNCTRIP